MGDRIDSLEKSISELIDQAGVDDQELQDDFDLDEGTESPDSASRETRDNGAEK